MLSTKEQAVIMLQSLPEEKMSYVIDMLKLISDILDDREKNNNQLFAQIENPSESLKAWERFRAYKGIIPHDLDTKVELAKARDEKYACFA